MKGEQKEMMSLESIGFPKHYVGLRWYNLDESQRNAHIKNLQNKHDESHGLLINGKDIEGEHVTSIGFANELSTRYYSAAAVVCKAISESYPNAYFVQKLHDGRYWYLLIKNHVPVTLKNDVILDDIEDVVELMNEHYQVFELHDVKLRYVIPREITDRVSGVFQENIDLYQDLDYPTINDAIEDLKFAQVKTVSSLLNTNPISGLPKKGILYVFLILAAALAFNHYSSPEEAEELLYDLDAITEKAMANSSRRLTGNTSNTQVNHGVVAADKISAAEEEAQWISQRLVASDPKKVILSFVDYVESLPININGWYPEKVDFRLKPTISKEQSSAESFADIEMFHKMVVTWRNGGASVADFRDGTKFDGDILFFLNGEIIETTDVFALPIPSQNLETLEAITFINDTKGKYLDILSFIQNEMRESSGKFNGSISTKLRKGREIPYKNLIYENTIDQPQIEYITLEVSINTSGYSWSFKNLRKLAEQLDMFPQLMVTHINLNLETEEVAMTLHYIHDKSILNKQEVKQSL